jgi:hypothetical protein
LAEWFEKRGWPRAYSKGASEPGKDIERMTGLSPEVKATTGSDYLGALRQAEANAAEGDVPFVIHRPNGYGPEKIDQWLMIFNLKDGTELLQKAGYKD